MNAKNFMWIFLAVACASIVAANASSSGDQALSIASLKLSPQPIIAGNNLTIVFQLYNSYSSALNNVNLQLTASNPIINVSPSAQQLITTIGTGLYGSGVGFSSFVYTVRIPSTLRAGQYTITVQANYQTTQPTSSGGTAVLPSVSTMPINFYVYGTPSIKLSANPQSIIVPGQSASIPITAVNTGTDSATNMTVILKSTRSFTVFGASQFNIGTLNASGTSTFTASIQPSLSITNGTYPINATVKYTANSGNVVMYNTTILITTLINSPNIVASIASASPTNLYSGGNQTLQVQLQNIGLGTAKNITAKFLNGPGINVGSISQFFIASLSPKNSTTVTVYISANRSLSSSNF